jgi:hypothetical protein
MWDPAGWEAVKTLASLRKEVEMNGQRLTAIGLLSLLAIITSEGAFARSAVAQAVLENPQAGSFTSGISLVSGWKCSATNITVAFDGGPTFDAAYGTARDDTKSICGDSNNGFGLLFNYGLLGNGQHTVHVFDGGVEFASATFTVTTLGESFVRGLSGMFLLEPFPNPGRGVTVQWDEALQNFVIVDKCGFAGQCPLKAIGFPATGQTTSYAPGDDGATRSGMALSFTDNGDGTITDNVTGLMWEKKSRDGSLHDREKSFTWAPGTGSIWEWIGQVNAENGKGFADHTDWRIPNVKELDSIVDYGFASPTASAEFNMSCTGSCGVTTCSCTKTSGYWSATTLPSLTTSAFVVRFSDGKISDSDKTMTAFARAVRGGL